MFWPKASDCQILFPAIMRQMNRPAPTDTFDLKDGRVGAPVLSLDYSSELPLTAILIILLLAIALTIAKGNTIYYH